MAGASLPAARGVPVTEAPEETSHEEQERNITNLQPHSMEDPGLAGGQLWGGAPLTETSQGTDDLKQEMESVLRFLQQRHYESLEMVCSRLSAFDKEHLPEQEEMIVESRKSQETFITVDLSDRRNRLKHFNLNHEGASAATIESPQIEEQEELNELEQQEQELEGQEQEQEGQEQEQEELEQVQQEQERGQGQEQEQVQDKKQEQEMQEQMQQEKAQEEQVPKKQHKQVQEKQLQEEQVQKKQNELVQKEQDKHVQKKKDGQVREKQLQEKQVQEKQEEEQKEQKREQKEQVQKEQEEQKGNEQEQDEEQEQGQGEEKLMQEEKVQQKQEEDTEQEQEGRERQEGRKQMEPNRQKEREQKHQEKQGQEEAAKNPDSSTSKYQTEVSAPEKAEELEQDEATGTASAEFLLVESRSITDVRENTQEKEKDTMAVGTAKDKQLEQSLPPTDNSDQAATDWRARDSNARGKRRSMDEWIIKLLVLILLSGGLICQAAPLLTVTSKIQGSGRPEQGQSYNLSCEVEGLTGRGATSSYVWYKDGTALSNEEKRVLHFPRLSQGDAGSYECEPKLSVNEGSLRRELFQLQVLVFENITMVPELEVEEGETVLINCSVNSVPTAHLVWTMDGEILRMVESNFDSLVLHNASQYHLKVFVCQASNREFFMRFLEKYTQIRIRGTYEVIPQPYLRGEGLSVLGRPFRLVCLVLDLPQNYVNIHLSYTWFKDSRKIPGQSGEVLQFSNLTREDGGEYQCRARNGKPQTTSPESHVKEVLVLLPPRVHVEPATPDNVIRRAAGEKLTLTCNVTEAIPWVPHNGYSWSYLPSPEGQLRSLGVRESTLTLDPLTMEDSGQYFCQARSDLEVFQGQIPPGNASVTVDVVYLEMMILTPDIEVNEGDRVTLTCRVKSNPAAHLAWIVDGQEVRHVTHNTDHYVLERAACSDNKMHKCRVSNTALPGLEKNASVNVRVNCSKADSDRPSSPIPHHGNKGENASGPNPSPLLWLLVLLVLVPVLAILFFHERHSLKKMMLPQKNPPPENYKESEEPLKPKPAQAAQERPG